MWPVIDNTLKLLAKGMDGSAFRNKVLANNIANVDTPHFKRQDVNFYSQLKSMMNDGMGSTPLRLVRTDEDHLVGRSKVHNSGFKVIQTDGRVREDGNNVNIDAEMAKMAENGAYYNTLATVVARKYKSIEQTIKGGER